MVAPTITSAATTAFTAGVSGSSFNVTTGGSLTPSLSESGDLPGSVAFTDNGDGTATFSGTPDSASGGNYNLEITADNGVGQTALQEFVLTIDQAPVITSDDVATFTVGSAGAIAVNATGFPNPTYSESGSLPSGVIFDTTTGTLRGTPSSGTDGTYSITLTASNGIGTNANQSFTLTVDAAPSSPDFTSNASTTFNVGMSGTFQPVASGTATITYAESSGLPAGVTFNATTGILSGTPTSGSAGNYDLVFTATDGASASATQNFVLKVEQPPDIISNDSAAFTSGSAGSIAVLTTGFPNATVNESGSLPSGVTFDATTGILSGTPAAGSGGTYDLTFSASNGVGSNATQDFVLTVDQPPAITSYYATTFTTGGSGTFDLTSSGFPAPTYAESGALPSGVTFDGNTGVLSGTPAAGTGGNYDLYFTAEDSAGVSATQNFVLTVDEPAGITSNSSVDFTAGSAGAFAVTTTGYPDRLMVGGVTFLLLR